MGISSSEEERRLTEWLHQSRSACPSVPEKLRKGLSTASPTEYTCTTRPTCRCTTWIYKTFARLITRSPRRIKFSVIVPLFVQHPRYVTDDLCQSIPLYTKCP